MKTAKAEPKLLGNLCIELNGREYCLLAKVGCAGGPNNPDIIHDGKLDSQRRSGVNSSVIEIPLLTEIPFNYSLTLSRWHIDSFTYAYRGHLAPYSRVEPMFSSRSGASRPVNSEVVLRILNRRPCAIPLKAEPRTRTLALAVE